MSAYQILGVLVWFLFPKISEFHSVLQKSVLCTSSVFQIYSGYTWTKTHIFILIFFLFFSPQNQISDLSIISSSGMQQNSNPLKPESTEPSEQKPSLQVQEQVCFIQP